MLFRCVLSSTIFFIIYSRLSCHSSDEQNRGFAISVRLKIPLSKTRSDLVASVALTYAIEGVEGMEVLLGDPVAFFPFKTLYDHCPVQSWHMFVCLRVLVV